MNSLKEMNEAQSSKISKLKSTLKIQEKEIKQKYEEIYAAENSILQVKLAKVTEINKQMESKLEKYK